MTYQFCSYLFGFLLFGDFSKMHKSFMKISCELLLTIYFFPTHEFYTLTSHTVTVVTIELNFIYKKPNAYVWRFRILIYAFIFNIQLTDRDQISSYTLFFFIIAYSYSVFSFCLPTYLPHSQRKGWAGFIWNCPCLVWMKSELN